MVLVCTVCKYKHEKENVPNKCPYCAREGTLQKPQSAQDLINNVMDEMEDIDMSRKERGY